MTDSVRCRAYQFGLFTLDLERGALRAGEDGEIPLRPKSFALLRLLVENAGRLLSREAIMEALWADVSVTNDSLTQCVHDIRSALGADARSMLSTRRRRGYLFASDVVAIPACIESNAPSTSHGCSTLRNGQIFKQVIDACQSSAVAVLAGCAGLV
jgi:adenylate cyclase